MSSRSINFTHAITRLPSRSIIDGLRAVDTGTPDIDTFRAHHADYIEALKSTGASVTELSALEDFPDSVFVEDAALCLPDLALVMRPGAASRVGEAEQLARDLRAVESRVVPFGGAGCSDGGGR
jgi:dimethylargininase